MGKLIRIRRKSAQIVWTTTPAPVVVAGVASSYTLPCTAPAGVTLAFSWKGPLPKPSWVTITGGLLQFNGLQVDTDDLTGCQITATATSYTPVDSPLFNIPVAPSQAVNPWTVPDQTWTQGAGTTYNLVPTVPGTVIAGGTFDVDPLGTPLPLNASLSTAGLLSLGSAGPGTTTGIIFGYTEPLGGGGALSTITVHSANSATKPYLATFFPLKAQVPNGQTISCTDDASMRCTILTRWTDGSAKVCVLAGVKALTTGANVLNLVVGADPGGTTLTAARVQAVLTNVVVDVGSTYTLTNVNLGSPARIWWQNAQTICARYYLPLLTGMVAAIDVHAFKDSSNCLVEVVVENGILDCNIGLSSMPVVPATRTVTNGSVKLNTSQQLGGLINSPVPGVTAIGGEPDNSGPRQWTTAWRDGNALVRRGWTGTDPDLVVTHNPTYLQQHPIFMKSWKALGPVRQAELQARAQTMYPDWHCGWYPASNPGDGSGREGLSPHPAWELDYVRSGIKELARCAVNSCFAFAPIRTHYRKPATAPNPYEILDYDTSANGGFLGRGAGAGNFPQLAGARNEYQWDPCMEVSHSPAVGLIPFLCHPSPMFIDFAKTACLVSLTSNWTGDNRLEEEQNRGKGWSLRNWGHAAFLIPDGDPWKTKLEAAVEKSLDIWQKYTLNADFQKLGFMWDYSATNVSENEPGATFPALYCGMQSSIFMQYWGTIVTHCIDKAEVFSTASTRTKLTTFANWFCNLALRVMMETTNGSWRFQMYRLPYGKSDTNSFPLNAENTWGEMLHWYLGRTGLSASGSAGEFMHGGNSQLWSNDSHSQRESPGADNYPSAFIGALAAGVERNNYPNALAAWTKLLTDHTSINEFANGFAESGRWGYYPRNY